LGILGSTLSLGFVALTAIFAKIGIENVNSDFATFIRTVIILLAAGLIVSVTGNSRQVYPRKEGDIVTLQASGQRSPD